MAVAPDGSVKLTNLARSKPADKGLELLALGNPVAAACPPAAFMKLPPAPYDAFDKVNTRVSSLSLVRYKKNDYSTPTRYGHQRGSGEGICRPG
ncbi:MAG: hypothetical protein WA624_13815 [Methylocella sp.]